MPQPLVDAVGAQRLQRTLDDEFGGEGTCFLVDGSGAQLAVHNPDTPLIGASTQKVLVAAAMLSTLGPDFRYETRAVAPAAPDNGVVDQLFLVGGGDPVLATDAYRDYLQTQPHTKGDVTTSLDTLAQSIYDAGVRRDPRRDRRRRLPLRRRPLRARRGRRRTTPAATSVRSARSPSTTASARGRRARPWSTTRRSTPPASWRACSPRAVSRSVPSPEASRPRDSAPIAKISSEPLNLVIGSMLSSSDNLSAEMFTKELGVRASQQGTTAAGTAAIMAKLTELGVAHDGLRLTDGSGLDRGNQVTCRTLVAALGLGNQPGMRAIWDGLPVAGVNGTLIDQLADTPLAGKVRGKTGSLDGVSGLLGMVDLGRSVSFAFLDNGDFSETKAAELRARAATLIATYPNAPSVDELVPQPIP